MTDKENILVSIIVLTYKRFDNLINNFTSIRSQSYKNYEVIVADDGSPNFDINYIESLYQNSGDAVKFIVYTQEKNVGTVKNYNSAIKRSKGEIIIPLSQDDIFADKYTIERIVKAFSDKETGICYGLRKEADSGSMAPNQEEITILTGDDQKKLWFRMACKNFIYGASLCFRRDFLIKNGLFDENYLLLEDYPFALKMIEQGEKIVYIPDPLIIYGTDGISKKLPLKLAEDNVRVYKEIVEKSKAILCSRLCKTYLKYRYLHYSEMLGKRSIKKYLDIPFDIFIWYMHWISSHSKEDEFEVCFKLLWERELQASKKKMRRLNAGH